MQILTSLEGLAGRGVEAVVVTSCPANATALAEALTCAGVINRVIHDRVRVGAIVRGVTHMIFAEKSADAEELTNYAHQQGMTIIDLGGNNL